MILGRRLLPAANRLAEMGSTVENMPEINPVKSRPDKLLADDDENKDS